MAEHKEKSKKEDVIEIPVGKYISSLRKNPWIISTVVLAVLVIVMIFVKSGGSGEVVSTELVEQRVLAFVNQQVQGGNAEVTSVSREGTLYNVVVQYDGQEIPVYTTLDGKYLITQPIPLSGDASAGGSVTPQAQEVPKSAKPVVELFIMSYCPYGTQMEKGILPVLATLGDSIDFTLRYTHFTLHGEKEDTENFRQLCIREEQSAKFLPYIQCTLDSSDPNAPGNVDACMKKLSINTAKVNTCMETKSAQYYAADSALSEGYAVQGSPTLVINGVEAQTSRSPQAVLQTICAAFTTAPAACSTQLSSDSPSAGFGYSASSGADTAAKNAAVGN